jgi:recombination associated protein RdgC
MWFKNLVVYRLPRGAGEADDLDRKLAAQALQPCGGFQMESRGWVCPHEDGLFVHRQNRHWLIALGEEQKLLPAAVVRQEAEDRARVIAREQGHPLGRKQMRDLKAQVLNELLPRALVRRRMLRAWIDAGGGWLAVDTSGEAGAEQFMEALRRSDERIAARRLETERSPAAALAAWLAQGDAPGAFTIDRDLELCANDGSRATVRYARHDLGGREIRDHLASGKVVVQLGLTWNERISFVLNDQLQIKRLAFLDILKRESDAEVENDEQQFELDFGLMSGELALLLRDLTEALGGEKSRD